MDMNQQKHKKHHFRKQGWAGRTCLEILRRLWHETTKTQETSRWQAGLGNFTVKTVLFFSNK